MSNQRTVRVEKKQETERQQWERLQLHRLFWALLLFLALFLGKQIYPGQILAAGERVMGVLDRSVDLEAVFSQLGESLTDDGGMFQGLESFCIEVFGVQTESELPKVEKTAVFQPVFPGTHGGILDETLKEIGLCEQTELKQNDLLSVPAVGTVVTDAEETGPKLPDGYTADELSFGGLKTVSPVLGHLNSAFGYRDHPVNGTYSFHGGADISANAGDAIAAFADGVVEYVGEDDTYGLYLQLDHGNEIKSFYAHCQDVFVQKGETVTAGETVAIVGATGRVTGPHLHLELKCCGVRVDPAYYVDFL